MNWTFKPTIIMKMVTTTKTHKKIRMMKLKANLGSSLLISFSRFICTDLENNQQKSLESLNQY